MTVYRLPLPYITILFPFQPCNEKPCPAQWSQWSEWSTCNNKEQSRNRTCTNGGQCNGPARETRQCRASSWSDWRPWSQCSATCGINGQQTRTRTCQGGNDCPNPETNVEKRPCQPQPPACVKWTQWSTWSACSRTCGNGEQSRNRSCVNEETNSTLTTALFSQCKGPNRETQKCNTGPCPTPKWSDWSDWGPCANGRQSRNRTCNGGTTCWGSATETRPCNGPAGGWQEWSQWSLCSKSCAGGEQTRQRKCSNGGPLGGKCPPGSANEKRPCNTQTCPSWGDWTWSGPCSVTCGNGVRRRSRTCNGGQGCIGVSEEVVACSNGACKN